MRRNGEIQHVKLFSGHRRTRRPQRWMPKMRLSPYFIPVILGLTMTAPALTPASAQVAVGISVNLAPPPIPVYAQPPIPGDGYLWTPGYWAWDAATGYYWVPGTWVRPPAVGLLWTPPYWGFE